METVIATHRQVAILPMDVSISAKHLPKDVTTEMLLEQEQDFSYVFQGLIYSQFLKKQKHYSVTFQDIDQTNALLRQNGAEYANMRNFSPQQLAGMLNVDAIIGGTIHMSRPMSTGAAIAVWLLTGYGGATNKVDIDLAIHDRVNGSLLWKYTYSWSGGVGSDASELAKTLMKKIARKFPY